MKKIFAMAVACMMAGAAMAEGSAEFKKGDFLVNVGVGVGTHGDEGTGPATFTQQASFEYALCNIGKKSTLSIGFMASNSWGDFGDVTLAGTYDYDYISTTSGRRITAVSSGWGRPKDYENYTYTTECHREGAGTADTEYSYDDIKLLPTLSYHCQVMPSLDLYATLGVGVAIMNKIISKDMKNYVGFEHENYDKRNDYSDGTWTRDTYSYDDKAHAEFEDASFHRASAAFVFKVGARYYFNQHWGMFGEFGLTAVTLKSATPKSWELLTAGATYKF